MQPEEQTANQAKPQSLRQLLARSLAGFVFLFGVVWTFGRLFRPQIDQFGRGFVGRFGYAGMFVGTFLADAFTVPLPGSFYFLTAITSGLPAMPTIVVVAAGSVLGAYVAYAIAHSVSRVRFLRSRMETTSRTMEPFFRRFGTLAIVLAGLLPLPFSITCYLAGLWRIPQPLFALFVALRVPRLIAYYFIIKAGLSG